MVMQEKASHKVIQEEAIQKVVVVLMLIQLIKKIPPE